VQESARTCIYCGYCLDGHPDQEARCPECGQVAYESDEEAIDPAFESVGDAVTKLAGSAILGIGGLALLFWSPLGLVILLIAGAIAALSAYKLRFVLTVTHYRRLFARRFALLVAWICGTIVVLYVCGAGADYLSNRVIQYYTLPLIAYLFVFPALITPLIGILYLFRRHFVKIGHVWYNLAQLADACKKGSQNGSRSGEFKTESKTNSKQGRS
jgi:hypothetical protein